MAPAYYVYLLTNRRNGTFCCGVTNNLVQRREQHRAGVAGSFTKRHGIRYLVWFETFEELSVARRREARIKRWPRAWKMNAIEAINPDWRDLTFALGGAAIPDCPPVPGPRTRRGRDGGPGIRRAGDF